MLSFGSTFGHPGDSFQHACKLSGVLGCPRVSCSRFEAGLASSTMLCLYDPRTVFVQAPYRTRTWLVWGPTGLVWVLCGSVRAKPSSNLLHRAERGEATPTRNRAKYEIRARTDPRAACGTRTWFVWIPYGARLGPVRGPHGAHTGIHRLVHDAHLGWGNLSKAMFLRYSGSHNVLAQW